MVHLYRAKSCAIGRLFFKRGIWPLSVVKSDPAVDHVFGLEEVLQLVQIASLLLERSPEPFDEDSVEVSPPPIYCNLDLCISQGGYSGRSGELRFLMYIHDFGFAVFGDGLFHRLNAKAGIQRVGEPPRQHLTRRPVHDGHKIKEPVRHWYLVNVATPDLVWARY